jgi:hypothetical protein
MGGYGRLMPTRIVFSVSKEGAGQVVVEEDVDHVSQMLLDSSKPSMMVTTLGAPALVMKAHVLMIQAYGT